MKHIVSTYAAVLRTTFSVPSGQTINAINLTSQARNPDLSNFSFARPAGPNTLGGISIPNKFQFDSETNTTTLALSAAEGLQAPSIAGRLPDTSVSELAANSSIPAFSCGTTGGTGEVTWRFDASLPADSCPASARPALRKDSREAKGVRRLTRLLLLFCSALAYSQVTINPGDNIQSKINANPAGTTFTINAGTYRITSALNPKTGDSFIGATSCNTNPIASPGACAAVISGSTVIGSLATFDGTNYEVTGQTQQGNSSGISSSNCQPGYTGCIYPEELWFDEVPYQHLGGSTLPTIAPGQWWFDYTNDIIYFHDNPSGHVVETSVAPGAFTSQAANNVTLQYLTFEEFAVPFTDFGAIQPWGAGESNTSRLAGGLNWVVENCELWGMHGSPINPNYGIQILNSYIHDNGQCGICGGWGALDGTHPSNVLIQGNFITHNDWNNYNNINPGQGAGGIKLGATYLAVIRNNLITYNGGAGFHCDASCSSPLVDGNTITDNIGGAGIVYEISTVSATFRNNILLRNGGTNAFNGYPNWAIQSIASVGVQAYCNFIEVSNLLGEQGLDVGASNRTFATPPGGHANSTGNSFHHNTVTWDSGAHGTVGYTNSDSSNQPNFLANNTPPDYNTYHLSNLSSTFFQYSNSGSGTLSFANYQAAGADAHGTADTNYTSGFPTVAITSPADQSTLGNVFAVAATASDTSGISKVEFYVDWNLQKTVNTPPFNFAWTNEASASHTIAAMAYSTAGIRDCYAVTLNMAGSADPGALVF